MQKFQCFKDANQKNKKKTSKSTLKLILINICIALKCTGTQNRNMHIVVAYFYV